MGVNKLEFQDVGLREDTRESYGCYSGVLLLFGQTNISGKTHFWYGIVNDLYI